MEKEYTYGVARVRALESSLFTDETILRLMAAKTMDECISFLKDQGWGNQSEDQNLEQILETEKNKAYEVLRDIVEEKDEYRILTVVNEYHNLKAAIKQACTATEVENVFVGGTDISTESLVDNIRQGKYELLPDDMQAIAKEATDILLRTGDGQLSDIIVDKAALVEMLRVAAESENEMIKRYADAFVTIANIKIAVRCAATKKDGQFVSNALVPCNGISITELINAVDNGMESVTAYLESVGFEDAVAALNSSMSVFECCLDNKLIENIKSEKYNSFTIGPIIAYVLARENEIKTVKIVVLGIVNGFDQEFIKERVRHMYA